MSLRKRVALHMACGLALWLGCAQPLSADPRSSFVIGQITAHNAGLSPAIRDEKYRDMSDSAVAFFRGTAHLYWADWGASAQLAQFGSAQTRIWLQGDAHTDNQGSFANSAGTLVYDLNDFDESVIGDYQLDLWRMATSLVLVARQNGGFSAAEEATLTDAFTDGYLDALSSYAGSDSERTRTFTADNTNGLLDDFLKDVAADRSRKKLLDKYTLKSGATRVFDIHNDDLAPLSDTTVQALRDALPAYGATLSGALSYSSSYFKLKSAAGRLHAGLGSLGAPRYYLLIEGPSSSADDDRILDVKAQTSPSAFATLDPDARSATDAASHGDAAERTIKAARSLGYKVDDHLGTLSALGLRFSVRERSAHADTFDTSELTSMTRITKLAAQWGAVLATAHARADRDADPAVIPFDFEQEVLKKLGSSRSLFRARIRQIASSYATQVEIDFAAFLSWRAP